MVAVLGLGFFFLHRPHDSRAERASSCLEKAGASVDQSSFVEDLFASGAAGQGAALPEPLRKAAAEVDKHLYEVDYGGSSALLIFTKGGRQADTIALQLAELSELSDMGPFNALRQRPGSLARIADGRRLGRCRGLSLVARERHGA